MAKVSSLSRKSTPHPRYGEGGFILLEVLVAMSMVASTWIAVMDSYSKLVLHLGALEKKRVSIYRDLDAYEIQLSQNQAINPALISQTQNEHDLIHEASRMSHRPGTLPHVSRGTFKK